MCQQHDCKLPNEFLLLFRIPVRSGGHHVIRKRGLLDETFAIAAYIAWIIAAKQEGRCPQCVFYSLHGLDGMDVKFITPSSTESQNPFTDSDVGVDLLPGVRIAVRRANREAGIVADHPADRVVTDVGRIPVGLLGLLLDNEGVFEAGILEPRIPKQNTVANPCTILKWD